MSSPKKQHPKDPASLSSDQSASGSITYPGEHDVMLGRGGESNYHSGNQRFRQFVKQYREEYQAAPRYKKPEIALKVVNDWRSQDPPGRFLARTDPDRADSLWHDVDDKLATKRALKNLGESDGKSKNKRPKRPSLPEETKSGPAGQEPASQQQHDDSVSLPSAFHANADQAGLDEFSSSHYPAIPVAPYASALGFPTDQGSIISRTQEIERRAHSNSAATSEQSFSAGFDDSGVTLPTAAALTENVFSSSEDGGDSGSN